MKTTFDAVNVIYAKLKTALAGQISGGVYKYKRPLNSTVEDVIINSLPMIPGTVSECVINVNCYVPDLSVKIAGVQNDDIPNSLRLATLATYVISQLASVAGSDYYYFVSNQATLENEAGNEHYVNIRIEFLFIENQ